MWGREPLDPTTTVYLDNAATSYPKPEAVYEALDRFMRRSLANPGRSGHRMAVESQRAVSQCRSLVARMFGASGPERVVFAFNATDALNTAIKGLIGRGDHVVTTQIEHNSVRRPLTGLAASHGVEVDWAPADGEGVVDAAAILGLVREDTRAVVMTHASNVVGTLQPVAEVARHLRETPTLLIVDAAQTAGCVDIDIHDMGIDALAFAGHKGLLGPTGTGGLVLGERALPTPLREGGTGTDSESSTHPEELPERLEAGTLNVAGLAGMAAGIRYLEERGVERVGDHERRMGQALHDALAGVRGLRVYGPADFGLRTGVVCTNIEGADPRDVAAMLDTSFGIASRPGLHCAPGAHGSLGTHPAGAVRLSPGPLTTDSDIDRAIEAMTQIAAALSV
ncbi:MAG: aminotransferase class V-fold PLP-dependent enzyme [Armatimonadia bacterium]|nr:aminotransferase class V-fold PLP-dependent enzyme [Armatimonadia bacterium]